MSAKLVELIETDELRGSGKEGDVFRRVKRWWTKEGELVAERDEWRTGKLENAEAELAKIGETLAASCPQFEGRVTREALPIVIESAKAWWEHVETANDPTRCSKPGCFNPCQLYSPGNYSKLCREHNAANAKRQREAREKSPRRPKK